MHDAFPNLEAVVFLKSFMRRDRESASGPLDR
jgi:hypothetical protein